MVYLIYNTAHNICKIGHSQNPLARLANLQTATPYLLQLAGTLPGGKEEEQNLHARFADLRIAGEWFHVTNELVNVFEPVVSDLYDPTAVTWWKDCLPLQVRLTTTGWKVLCYIQANMPINGTVVEIDTAACMARCGFKQAMSHFSGIRELIYYGFIAKKSKALYHINTNWFFRGLQIPATHAFEPVASYEALPKFLRTAKKHATQAEQE